MRFYSLVFLFFVGCSSSRMTDRLTNQLFTKRKFDEASARLTLGAEKKQDPDHLLYLLDLALTLHTAGHYQQSSAVFFQAERLTEWSESLSLLKESQSLLTSQNVKTYQGEDFEKVLIHTFLAMNFALLGDFEEALVEARKVNRKLGQLLSLGRKASQESVFARYLSGILYEIEGQWNDAYIDYKKVSKLRPDLSFIWGDLWRASTHLHLKKEAKIWLSRMREQSNSLPFKVLSSEETSEIIVFYENGIAPEKRPHPDFSNIPKYYPKWNPVRSANVYLNQKKVGSPFLLDDLEAMAISHLDEKISAIIANRLLGVAVKGALSYAIAEKTNQSFLGFLAANILLQSDQADLRAWSLLPRDLQVLRIPVEKGDYEVCLLPENERPLPSQKIRVGQYQKVFVNFRYIPQS